MKLNLLVKRDISNVWCTFSNIDREDTDEFYSLAFYYQYKEGPEPYRGNVTVKQCRRALRKVNKNYKYITI